MNEIFEEILSKIIENDSIIIHRHIRPDGDCIGSQSGLKQLILDNFPNKKVYAVGTEAPDYLKPMMIADEVSDDIYKDSLVIVCDTATEDRIYDERWKTGKFIIKIDHHDDSPEYGNLCYIDPESPSCCSILVRMAKQWGDRINVTKEAATYLYYGIITDTGRFKYRGVNGEVLENAGFLVNKGVDIQSMYDAMYVDELRVLKLKGYVLNNFKVTPNGVAYMYFTEKMMKKFGVDKIEAGNLVNEISTIKGCLIWVAFIDQMLPKDKNNKNKVERPENEIRVRIRSRHVAVNEVATHYRGGGHLQACGSTIYSKKEMNSLLNELDATLKVYKEEHPDAY